MALGTTNITTSLVASEIGELSTDVGALCSSDKINKWSKWKPLRSNKKSGLTTTDVENLSSGIFRVNELTTPWNFEYLNPRGGVNEPYRLGDFRNYNHSAGTPVQIQILSVSSGMFSTQTTAPFTLILGLTYDINFKLVLAGEINPTTINPLTNRTKNIDSGGGYGGLSWVTNPHSAWGDPIYRASEDVFTCPTPGNLSQEITVLSYDIRMQYCKYNGDIDGRYEILHGLWAETENVWNNFIVRNLNTSLNFSTSTSFNIYYSSLDNKVYTNLIVHNNESFDLNRTRIKCLYKINGGSEYTIVTSDFITDANSTENKTLTLGGWIAGENNTFYVRALLETYNTKSDTWQEIGYDVLTKTINIPLPE